MSTLAQDTVPVGACAAAVWLLHVSHFGREIVLHTEMSLLTGNQARAPPKSPQRSAGQAVSGCISLQSSFHAPIRHSEEAREVLRIHLTARDTCRSASFAGSIVREWFNGLSTAANDAATRSTNSRQLWHATWCRFHADIRLRFFEHGYSL